MRKFFKDIIVAVLAIALFLAFVPMLRKVIFDLEYESASETTANDVTIEESTSIDDAEDSSADEESSEAETTDSSAAELVPGLYETGSNYGTLLASWDDLVNDGAIVVTDGAVLLGVDKSVVPSGLNEWGFYYDVQYYFAGEDVGLVFHSDTSFDMYSGGLLSESVPAEVISYGSEGIDMSALGWGVGVPSTGGMSIAFDDMGLVFGLEDSYPLAGDLMLPTDGSVTSIATCGFYNCSSLTGITIPDSVASIGESAFDGCSLLENVIYSGTANQLGVALDGCTPFIDIALDVVSCSDGEFFVGLISDTWEEIVAHVNDGTYATRYCVGAYKPLDLGSEGVVNMEIAALDADVLSDGTGNAHISWIATEFFATCHVMNSSATNTNGWAACDMRKYLQEDIWALIPTDVQNGIVAVDKTYYDETSGSTLTCSDALWIPSAREIGSNSHEASGVSYGLFFARNALSEFWTRTASGDDSFRYSPSNFMKANVAGSVLLGFCF